MNGNHIIPAHAVATLILIDAALNEILITESAEPDLLEELEYLQGRLQGIIRQLKRESPLTTARLKARYREPTNPPERVCVYYKPPAPGNQ